MTALALTLTPEGIAAAINADNTGTGPIVITQIALLSDAATEIKRTTTIGGDSVADNIIHVTITDETADTYALRGLRLITDGGIVFGYYNQATPILEKGADQLVLISADIVLTSVPPGSVTIGGTGFAYPPATTTRKGVIEIATDAEALAGGDTERALTPSALQSLAATAPPAMDGTATAGTAKRWSRADHTHPSDTAKVNRAGDTVTGQLASNKGNLNPAYAANYAWKSAGSYGGGWVIQDGVYNIGLFSVGGDLCFGFGADGGITVKAYISKAGEGIFGQVVMARSDTEAQLVARSSGQPDAYLFNNATAWGLFSAAGSTLISYDRTTGKRYVAGIDTTTLVLNNGATYTLSINGSAYYASSAGNAGTLSGMPAGYYTDIPARLGYTPVQQGTGAGQGANVVKIGWNSGWLRVQVDNTDFASTWPININGNAITVGGYTAADLWRKDQVIISEGEIGYIVFPPDGAGRRYCRQWGYFTAGDGDRTITFPIAFTVCRGVFESGRGMSAWPEVSKRYVSGIGPTGFTASLGGTGLTEGKWEAHGYI